MVYFIKNKSEMKNVIEMYIKGVKTETGSKVKILRTDNGLEFVNKDMTGITRNLKWPDIISLLLPVPNEIHRHDITARVFKQNLKSLMKVFNKITCIRFHMFLDVFG